MEVSSVANGSPKKVSVTFGPPPKETSVIQSFKVQTMGEGKDIFEKEQEYKLVDNKPIKTNNTKQVLEVFV